VAGKINIVGITVDPETIKYIKEDIINITYALEPYVEGYLAAVVLYDMSLHGPNIILNLVSKKDGYPFVALGMTSVNRDNLQEFHELLQKRGVPHKWTP